MEKKNNSFFGVAAFQFQTAEGEKIKPVLYVHYIRDNLMGMQ